MIYYEHGRTRRKGPFSSAKPCKKQQVEKEIKEMRMWKGIDLRSRRRL
jgi:hypothetical protein